MKKIRINLASGITQEKPLITAFKGTNGSYVVLDNEANGSMGLPIILVCKLENGKLIKINDQTEWNNVKENLKSIIAGGQIEYIKVDDVINADDMYYNQLTLPVVSFDALKNNYKVEDGTENATASIFDINPEPVTNANIPVENGMPASNVMNNPGIGEINSMNTNVNVTPENPVQTPVAPDVPVQAPVPEVNNVVEPNLSAPAIDLGINNMSTPTQAEPTPISNEDPVAPTVNVNPSVDLETPLADTTNLENQINDIVSGPVPNVEPQNNVSNIEVEPPITNVGLNDDLFKDQKEAFMQACENMFDALVQKFEKELEKR